MRARLGLIPSSFDYQFSFVLYRILCFLVYKRKTKAVCAFYSIVKPGSMRLLDPSIVALRAFA